jgi:hypothetical protein
MPIPVFIVDTPPAQLVFISRPQVFHGSTRVPRRRYLPLRIHTIVAVHPLDHWQMLQSGLMA